MSGPLARDSAITEQTQHKAAEIFRGRRNVRSFYTIVGTVRIREHYESKCTEGKSFANGYGEMGFAPAVLMAETWLNPEMKERSPSDDHRNQASPCPAPKDPAALNSSGEKPLCTALSNGWSDLARSLLAGGAMPDNSAGSNCNLLSAAVWGDAKLIEVLARDRMNLEVRDTRGRTPLMWAAEWGGSQNVEALLKAGASLTAKDHDGDTALSLSASSWQESARVLLKAGADPNAARNDGMTALMLAAWESRDDIVKLLLDAGALVNVASDDGETALHKAVRSGYTDAIIALMAAGADPEIRNKAGQSPRGLALGYQVEALTRTR